MLTMILADDEPAITSGIQKLIDWPQLGIKITGVYNNGQEALHAILGEKPDIAILDVSMPSKTGLEILRELAAAHTTTKVIFLSGFQEFEFAQQAVQYGAKEYLLKPVNKESLINAVRKCIDTSADMAHFGSKTVFSTGDFLPTNAYEKLTRKQRSEFYLCLAETISFDDFGKIERQMGLFSLLGKIEEYLCEKDAGIVFQKDEKIWLVLEKESIVEPAGFLNEMRNFLLPQYDTGFVVSGIVPQVSMLADKTKLCIEKSGYFYFWDNIPLKILLEQEQVFEKIYENEGLKEIRNNIVDAIIEQKSDYMKEQIVEYAYAACTVSGNSGDTAIYYLLSCIRETEEHLDKLGYYKADSLIVETMDTAREYKRFAKTVQLFAQIMDTFFNTISSLMRSNDKKDIVKAKNYIKEHYAENLTLEVLAKYIHMNPFYFSSFFKKHAGENFKDYLSKIRLKHGVELLMLSDKKIYEIAEEIGFKDYRYFTELFNRKYGKTPMAYRKDSLKNTQDIWQE